MRAAIYTRVSSEEQVDGFSLSAQAELCQRYAEQKGWQLVCIYEERGRSGRNALRPEFQQMIKDAEAGLFEVLVVHKLDRFSRSLVDMMTYLKRLKEISVSIVSVTEDFDFTTPFGKVILAMLASFAEWYLDNLRNEIMKGKHERARKGHWNGTLSWGYTTPKKLRQKLLKLGEDFKAGNINEAVYAHRAESIEKTLERYGDAIETAAVPCPFSADGVRFAFEMFSKGIYSDRDVADLIFQAGYRIDGREGNTIISKDGVEDILQNRFYIGYTSYGRRVSGKKREWMPGQHDAIIEPELFERCQEVRKRRAELYSRGLAGEKSVYPLVSILVCSDCGTMHVGRSHQDNGRRYRDPSSMKKRTCSQHRKSMPCEELEAIINDFLRRIRLPDNWQEQVLQGLRDDEPDIEVISAQRRAIETRMERAKKLYVMGDIKEKEYLELKDELAHQLEILPLPNGATMLDLKYTVGLLEDLQRIVESATPEERRQLYKSLFHRIYMDNGEIESIEPTPVLWALLDVLSVQHTGRTGFEPANGSYPPLTA